MNDYPQSPLPPPLPAPGSAGLALASLILGIVALASSVLVVGALLGALGMLLGALHVARRRHARAMAFTGIGLSACATAVGLLLLPVYTHFYREVVPKLDTEDYWKMEERMLARWKGVRAPEFTVTTFDGKELVLSSLRGRRVLVHMWASWDDSVPERIGHLKQLATELPADALLIVGLGDEDRETIELFIQEEGVNFPMASSEELPPPYLDALGVPVTFSIDRNGVIQHTVIEELSIEAWRELATGADFEGVPSEAPPIAPDDLKASVTPLAAVERWTIEVSGATGMCAGDWDGDGADEILVADETPELAVYDLNGQELERVSLPGEFDVLELGSHRDGLRLLGRNFWDDSINVMDQSGALIWEYTTWLGIEGAHWGDADGDGSDEMALGLTSGLTLLSDSGKKAWKKSFGDVHCGAFVRTMDGMVRIVETEEGHIVLFDEAGVKRASIAPDDDYYLRSTAAAVEGGERIQILASGLARTVACGEDGTVQWGTPASGYDTQWRDVCFANGDINADGTPDWAFFGLDGDLLVASASGERIAVLPDMGGIFGFAFAGNTLVVLEEESLTAYGFEPVVESAEAPPPESTPGVE